MEIPRRAFLASGAMSAFALTSRVRAEWKPSQRYPDPHVRSIDASFEKYRLSLAKVERLFTCGSTSVYSLFVNTQGAAGG